MNGFSKNQVNFYLVTEADENMRLDNLLVKYLFGVPKAHIYRIIRAGEVRVNKKRSEVSYKVKLNDFIRIPPISVATKIKKTAPCANFEILFEDDYFFIINKPAGIACHGGSGISFGIIEQLRQTLLNTKFLELVHRLDKETSGILILAKKRQALVKLQEQIRNKELKKYYLALAIGKWNKSTCSVKLPLVKYLTKDGERRVRVDKEEGQYSETSFSVIKLFDKFTLLKANLKTGRTHQIRVHLQHLDTPIAGDDKYGDFEYNKILAKTGLKRMFLHAYEIEFIHPITLAKIKIVNDLPEGLQSFIQLLEQNS